MCTCKKISYYQRLNVYSDPFCVGLGTMFRLVARLGLGLEYKSSSEPSQCHIPHNACSGSLQNIAYSLSTIWSDGCTCYPIPKAFLETVGSIIWGTLPNIDILRDLDLLNVIDVECIIQAGPSFCSSKQNALSALNFNTTACHISIKAEKGHSSNWSRYKMQLCINRALFKVQSVSTM